MGDPLKCIRHIWRPLSADEDCTFRFTVVAVPLALLRGGGSGQLGAGVLLEAVPPCSFEEAAGSVAIEPAVTNTNNNN